MKKVSQSIGSDWHGEKDENSGFRQDETGESSEEREENCSSEDPRINAKTSSANGKGMSKDEKRARRDLVTDWRKYGIKKSAPLVKATFEIGSKENGP